MCTLLKILQSGCTNGSIDGKFRYTIGHIRWYPTPEIANSWDRFWKYPAPFDCTGVPRGEDMKMNPDELPTSLTECRILCCFPVTERGKGGWANEYMRDVCNENNCHYEVDNEGNAFCTAEGSYHDCETDNCAFRSVGIDKKCPMDENRLFKTTDLTLTECYEECYNTDGCHYFSFGAGTCMGCIAGSVLPDWTGFNAQKMLLTKTLNAGARIL